MAREGQSEGFVGLFFSRKVAATRKTEEFYTFFMFVLVIREVVVQLRKRDLSVACSKSKP